ncbi:diaminopimelate decarboxylase [Kiritimatiellota bacterium B12222]|nr:diaminopimelate decarboxylase [Kiritimatiellota bacterium B12222]
MNLENLRFLSPDQVRQLASEFGTPHYVYSEDLLCQRAKETLAFPHAFGLTVRFAMKACPNRNVLSIFSNMGLHIDASSGWEVQRAMAAGIPASHISLSAQELPANLGELLDLGIVFNATSLNQIRQTGELRPGREIGVRFNPGLGSGGTNRTNVGGPASSFGIWHEQADEAMTLLEQYQLKCVRIHSHIGSGSDPAVWQRVAGLNLELVRKFPDVHTLDLGGGFKVGRMASEQSTDLQEIGAPIRDALKAFATETGRELHLEIEPGTYLVANAGAIISRIQDKVNTGEAGYTFYRLDTGMTDVLRPSLYGAQHPLIVVGRDQDLVDTHEAIIVGHCCESGDILTPAVGDPEALQPRRVHQAEINDYLVIEGTGAYCSAMCTHNYNSFPTSPEVLVQQDGNYKMIRKPQPIESLWEREI